MKWFTDNAITDVSGISEALKVNGTLEELWLGSMTHTSRAQNTPQRSDQQIEENMNSEPTVRRHQQSV